VDEALGGIRARLDEEGMNYKMLQSSFTTTAKK